MSVSIALTVTITPYMERKEGTGECGKCVMGGSRGNLHPLELQESDHQNQPVSTLCFPKQGSIGGAQALPLPPRSFLFWRGWRAGRGPGPALCVVGGVVPGTSVFPSSATRMSGNFWGSIKGATYHFALEDMTKKSHKVLPLSENVEVLNKEKKIHRLLRSLVRMTLLSVKL